VCGPHWPSGLYTPSSRLLVCSLGRLVPAPERTVHEAIWAPRIFETLAASKWRRRLFRLRCQSPARAVELPTGCFTRSCDPNSHIQSLARPPPQRCSANRHLPWPPQPVAQLSEGGRTLEEPLTQQANQGAQPGRSTWVQRLPRSGTFFVAFDSQPCAVAIIDEPLGGTPLASLWPARAGVRPGVRPEAARSAQEKTSSLKMEPARGGLACSFSAFRRHPCSSPGPPSLASRWLNSLPHVWRAGARVQPNDC